MDYLQTLGQRIKDLRKALGISQTKFALMIGMNKSRLSDIECGKGNVTFLNLVKISKGLNVSLEELFKGM